MLNHKLKLIKYIKFAAIVVFIQANSASSESAYPSKPIIIVVPYAAGGGADQLARKIGQLLSTKLQQPVLIDNRPGASNTIGMSYVAKARPDGYTLGFATPTFLMTPSIFKNLPYDPIEDFTGVALIVDVPIFLAVNSKLPVNSIQELIEYGRKYPDRLSWASGGSASTQGLAGLMFNSAAGIDATQIQYKGSSEALKDLLAGNVQFMFNSMQSMTQYEKGGYIRILGFAGEQKSIRYPDYPLISDVLPGYHLAGWFGLVAPQGTPNAVLDLLNKEIGNIIKNETTRDFLGKEGLEPRNISRETFNKMMRKELTKYEKLLAAQKLIDK